MRKMAITMPDVVPAKEISKRRVSSTGLVRASAFFFSFQFSKTDFDMACYWSLGSQKFAKKVKVQMRTD